MRNVHRRMPGRGDLGRRYLCDRPIEVHRLRHLRRRMPQRSDRSRGVVLRTIRFAPHQAGAGRIRIIPGLSLPCGLPATASSAGRAVHTLPVGMVQTGKAGRQLKPASLVAPHIQNTGKGPEGERNFPSRPKQKRRPKPSGAFITIGRTDQYPNSSRWLTSCTGPIVRR